jgi:hypothetical protein
MRVAVVRIEFHDVPKNRPAAHIHKGLGPILGFFPKPGTLAATQDNDFHNGNLKTQLRAYPKNSVSLKERGFSRVIRIGSKQFPERQGPPAAGLMPANRQRP